MRTAYTGLRLAGWSRRESLRLAVLVARLSLRDSPTDTWGRPRKPSRERASHPREADLG